MSRQPTSAESIRASRTNVLPVEKRPPWVALIVSGVAIAALLWFYGPLLPLLVHLAGELPLLFVTIVLPFLMVFGLLGRGYGLNRVFLHERPVRRLTAAFSLTLLVFNFVAVAYFVAIRPGDEYATSRLQEGLEGFLRPRGDIGQGAASPGPLLGVGAWVEGRAHPASEWIGRTLGQPPSDRVSGPFSFREESVGRLISFLIVAVPPPLVLLSLAAFFPRLARIRRTSRRSPGHGPRPKSVRLAWAWVAGMVLGVVTAAVLVTTGHLAYLALSALSGRTVDGARQAHAEVQSLRGKLDGARPPAPDRLSEIKGDFNALKTSYSRLFDVERARDRLRRERAIVDGSEAVARIAQVIEQAERRGLVPALAGMWLGVPGAALAAPETVRLPDEVRQERPGGPVLREADLEAIRAALPPIETAIEDLRDRAERREIIRNSTLSFLAIGLVVLVALALVPPLYRRVTSAFAICTVFSFLATATAAFACVVFPDFEGRNAGWNLAVVGGLTVLVVLTNLPHFKFKFDSLDYSSLQDLNRPLTASIDLPSKTNDDAALQAWSRALVTRADSGEETRPKLVVVAVSGGAVRSAVWVTLVLEKLCEAIPEFARHIRIISGASGGMVGAGYFVKSFHEHLNAGRPPSAFDGDAAGRVVERVNRDALDPVAKQLALRDAPSILFPWPQGNDRGKALERTWLDEADRGTAGSHSARSGLRVPLGDLKEREERGQIPSLIFSPMMVEDGRRLLISNLELPYMTFAGDHALLDRATLATYGRRLSSSAVEFRELFGDSPEARGFLLSTAVRMSASFPYVSPAVMLPTRQTRRVVDAGYYDNYGIGVASRWLYRHRDELESLTSGVVLVQIRDQVSTASRLGAGVGERSGSQAFRAVSDAFSFLTSPPKGAESARLASTAFRNDENLMTLSNLMNGGDRSFFTSVAFEVGAEVSLSWSLSDDELEELRGQLEPTPGPDGEETNPNLERLEKLQAWWSNARAIGLDRARPEKTAR